MTIAVGLQIATASVAVVNAVKGGATPFELVSAKVPITSGLVDR